ncbi:ribbon-helix-helix protein, CopG family, partial [candidate division WS5 bacterium]
MIKTASKIERITISLPKELSEDIDSLKEELHVSKSEIL